MKIASLFGFKPTTPTTTEDLLEECGDVLGEMFHPDFKFVAFCHANQVAAFGQGVAHGYQ